MSLKWRYQRALTTPELKAERAQFIRDNAEHIDEQHSRQVDRMSKEIAYGHIARSKCSRLKDLLCQARNHVSCQKLLDQIDKELGT